MFPILKNRDSVEMSKKIQQHRSGIFVSPGQKLGVIEEFIPGIGTYVEAGNIYSLMIGQLLLDKNRRELHIHSVARQPLIPRVDDTVIGEVISTQEKILTLRILQIGDKQLSDSFNGIMHISDVSQGYVKTMSDAFKVGDIVRAKVISTQNRETHLSTRDEKLGVIQAICVNCGGPLVRQRNNLRCTRCNRIDKRKISDDY